MFIEILEVLLEAVLDSLKMLPVIVLCYILIELLEDKVLKKYKSSKLLNGKFAPVFSAGFGLIPQCGFSVVATDLYSKRIITIGSLMAIYLATSDEALPILLSNPDRYVDMILILSIKFIYAVLIGITLDAIFRRRITPIFKENGANGHQESVCGCCQHHLEDGKKTVKEILIHPLIHSLKIFSFILIINIIFGLLIFYVGEDNVKNFMLSFGFFQPFLVGLVGMIPNCSASVLITELFIIGNISLGSCIAGLSVNAGIALILLFRLNKKLKENILIAISLYVLGVLLGIIVNFF
ncbi:MAG: hypothetical protein EOM55_02060 [Clostridia bacterium]|nr:hypothetical protein [Clostridia bacterium]